MRPVDGEQLCSEGVTPTGARCCAHPPTRPPASSPPPPQVFQALEKWTRVRPADREELCTQCVTRAVYEAVNAHTAKQAAAAQQQADGGGDGGEERGGGSDERAAAESAAAEALQARLHGMERCSACTRRQALGGGGGGAPVAPCVRRCMQHGMGTEEPPLPPTSHPLPTPHPHPQRRL